MNQTEMKAFLLEAINKRHDFKEALYDLQARMSIEFKRAYRMRLKPESKLACIREFSQRLEAFRTKWNQDPDNIERSYYIDTQDLQDALRL